MSVDPNRAARLMKRYLRTVQTRDEASAAAEEMRRRATKLGTRADAFGARAQELWRELKTLLGDRFLEAEPQPRLFPVGAAPKARLLRALRKARGAVSGRELARRLRIHVSRVGHVVRALRADGVPIRASHRGGYWLAPGDDPAETRAKSSAARPRKPRRGPRAAVGEAGRRP